MFLRKSGNTLGKRRFHKGFGHFVSKTLPDQMHNINVVCCLAGNKAGIPNFVKNLEIFLFIREVK